MANHDRIHLNLGVSPVKNYTGGVAADDIPDQMIHRIQSFMDSRLAARSTVLFNSWRRAWLTRPDLDFREQDFQSRSIEFREFATSTLQRYEDLQLRINTFRLEMEATVDCPLATEFIEKAIRLGATKLTLRIRRCTRNMFNLLNVVLDSETLAGLSAHQCLIDLQYGKKDVSWSNLKTLSLSQVVTRGDLFLDLILKCPSLENITLGRTRSAWLRGEPSPRPLTPSCDSMIQLHKLKSLQLHYLDSRDNIYRHDLWPKFPWLKELLVWGYNSDYDWNGLTICSRSLEIITLHTYANKITNGKFDVPNIRKFKVVGVHLPQLDEFKTSSKREWESDIHIKCDQLTVSWFSSLSKLLRMLSPSRISLSVWMAYINVAQLFFHVGDGLPIPVVENLRILGYPIIFSVFLSALFYSCRPNLVIVDSRLMEEVNLATILPDSKNPPHFQLI
ncbi:uncharacterized protein LOC125209201 [Salvia hispanica]|uniref:uncharacterized protein LOC125209201 n=1 Tax=Salvia hispanica TaxID=49212 RepID=UPI0020093750|nr:uncharacterized protein LOC125209201 [Salvia hispanica]